MAFFIFLFSLLNANLIHTNTILYTNFYANSGTKELYLTNSLEGINHCVQWEIKFTLLHENFNFSKNVVRNFNLILLFTIFMLIFIIRKSFIKKSRLNFPSYSIIFLTLVILKPASDPKITWWYKFQSWSYSKQRFPVLLETFWK